MIRLLADENFNGKVVHGLRVRDRGVDLVRAQDVGLMGAPDPDVLAWAAREARVLLTHDVRTMERFAYERVGRGEPMPGVFLIGRRMPIARAIEEILVVAIASREGEWEGQVRHLPL